MLINGYRRALNALKQWFEATKQSIGPVPVPIKVRINESNSIKRNSIIRKKTHY